MFALQVLEPSVLVLGLGPCIQEACMLEVFFGFGALYTGFCCGGATGFGGAL